MTFLFTDIEGSTARWEHQPEVMARALARHDALVRAAIQAHGGYVVKTMGDAFHAAFARASDAVAAALDAQRWLDAEPWGEIGPIRVRMALHTGAADERDGDYYGPVLNRAARLMSAGHGGQVLLSQATYDLVQDDVPADASPLDLGEHRLKDLIRPERIYQLVATGLPSEFPPLRSLDARPHNLPVQTTPLLGREAEVAAARSRLLRPEVRLLTLTGPGGTGKTRLSLQVAADLVDHFPDGAFFVALAPISAPDLVPVAIAHALQLRDVGGRPLLETLKEYLRNRALLLVLDNFEQILSAAPFVADLLGASQRLKVLVTSRAPLALRGEHEFRVPPLALPDEGQVDAFDNLLRYPAVALFAERAAAIRSDFTLTEDNAPAVAEICARLDGLPLAIELAAARSRMLSPQAMLARLDRRLPLLTGGARDLPERQRTLRDTISWSYELLSEPEQRLFRRLSIFVGGFTPEAAEAVCAGAGDPEIDTLDGLESLVARSLLREADRPDGEPRFSMLETIREYGLDQLEASGETEATGQTHAEYYVMLAETAEPMLHGRDQIQWLHRLDPERDNVRAVLRASIEGQIDGRFGLRLVGALSWYWVFRGLVGEGRTWADAILGLPVSDTRTLARARALSTSARMVNFQGDYATSITYANESVAIFKELGDLRGAGRTVIQESIATAQLGDPVRAKALSMESVALARAADDAWGLAMNLGQLGGGEYVDGNYELARTYRAEGASRARAIGDRYTFGLGTVGLALVALEEGNLEEAASRFKEAMVASAELEDPWIAPRALAGLASIAARKGDHVRTAWLTGAAEAIRELSGTREQPMWRAVFDRDAATARAALGEEAFAAAWAQGRAMEMTRAVTFALEDTP